MARPDFFYRLNNILLVAFVIFAGFLLYSRLQYAQSQSYNINTTSTTPLEAYLINREADVSIDPGSFTAEFLSDGFSGKAAGTQKEKFLGKADKSPPDFSLIKTPITFTFDPEASKLILPGELVYPAIPKATAPSGYKCVKRGSSGDDPENRRNCLFNVQSVSVYSNLVASSVVIGDQEFKVKEGENLFAKLIDSLLSIDYRLGRIITATGLTDPTRTAIGTVIFWGDDNFQQFVPINKKALFKVVARTSSTGVNVSEGLFPTDLSSELDAQITIQYKQPNILRAQMSRIVGAGEIYDPITADPQGTNNALVSVISEAFMRLVTGSNQKFTQSQERLSNQVALRPIQATTEYNVKYRLCDAFASDPGRFSYLKEYPNPYGKFQPEFITSTQIIGGILVENKEKNPLYEPWANYEYMLMVKGNRIGGNNNRDVSKIKKCIDGVAKHIDATTGEKCAKYVAEKKQGCDEFSVEEKGMNMSMMEEAFPVGLGPYFQNSTLKGVQPSLNGPFLNYLSPHLCAKLNLAFNIKAGASYMYHVGTEDGKSSKVKNSRGELVAADVVNEYCVLGGVMSNFSWAMTNQLSNFSSDVADGLVFNLPKEALTCDKKEIVHFGAKNIKTNIPSANNEPVYIIDDNMRGGGITNDEIVIYRGYNAYSLSKIFKNELKDKTIYKYGVDYDMQVLLDSSTKRPKYFVAPVSMGSKTMGIYVCKIPTASEGGYLGSKTQKSYCKLVDQGGFILPYGSALNRHEVRPGVFIDTITVIYNDPDTAENEPVLKLYKYIDIIDENDIQASIVSSQHYTFLQKEAWVSPLQLNNGNLAVSYLARGNDTITDIGVRVLDPTVNAGAKFEFNAEGKITSVTRTEANSKDISGNLCDTTPKYCDVLNYGQYVDRVAIAQSDTGGIYVVAVSAGKGVVYPVDPTGSTKLITPFVFAYKQKSNTYLDETDRISAMRVDSAGDIHIFLGISGFYLHVISQKNVINNETLQNIRSACGINCLPTVQMQFDPEQFITDCSDYKGSGACGFPSMNKLGAPIVTDFTFTGNGEIRARYLHSGLDKTLLESEDFLYSMSGVYNRLDDNGPEVSNVYIPNLLSSRPIRYFNQGNGGLQIGRDVDENLRESILFNQVGSSVSPIFAGYDRQNKAEKIDCLIRYSSKDSVGDIFYQQRGITPINLNPTTIADITLPSSSGSMSSNNSGEYCEETWCVPDEVQFVGDPMFKDDGADTQSGRELRQKIANYLDRDISYVNQLCAAASEKSVSCAFLAAIWKAESSASTVEPQVNRTGPTGNIKVPTPDMLTSAPQFGCMLYSTSYCKSEEGQNDTYCQRWYTFSNQIKCAVNTLVNRYNEYTPGVVITGPSDRIGKPYVTNVNRGGGACVPATRFSYVMQKYTPIDKRINNDNQCNTGLVVRDKMLQDAYCEGIKPSADSRNSAGEAALPEDWGDIIRSRPNMQNSLLNMDPRLRANESRCFPNKNQTNPENATGNADIAKVLTEYDVTSVTDTKGIVKLNLKNWTTDDAAGNIYMALRILNNGKLEGAHVVSPGQEFSFNDTVGNPTDRVVKPLEERVAAIKAPWNGGKNFVYDGSTVVGGGWCELSTGIRMSAEMLRAKDGTILKQNRFTSASAVGAPSKGNGTGYQGDINHWTHSGDTLYKSYNNLLVPGFGVPLQGPDKFIAIWTQERPDLRTGFNDADLVLRNPYPAGSGVDMIITIQLGDDGVITIETMFGKKRSDSRVTDVCSPTSMISMEVVGPRLQRDSNGRIIGGTALAQPAAEAYAKARTEIKEKTGEDVLGTVADMLRLYSAAPTNNNSIDKSWHKTGRAVDLNLGSGMGKVCSKNEPCVTGRVADGIMWRLYYNGVDITAIMEKYGWTRIPDQCRFNPGKLCTEWWHYEYKSGNISWEQAMLQVWTKEELKSHFKDVNWDSISCVD